MFKINIYIYIDPKNGLLSLVHT